MLGPVLYDFRRGLLRPAVVVLLVAFALAGAGLTYLAASQLSGSRSPLYVVGTIAALDLAKGRLYVSGAIGVPSGRPTPLDVVVELSEVNETSPAEGWPSPWGSGEKPILSQRLTATGFFEASWPLSPGSLRQNATYLLTISVYGPLGSSSSVSVLRVPTGDVKLVCANGAPIVNTSTHEVVGCGKVLLYVRVTGRGAVDVVTHAAVMFYLSEPRNASVAIALANGTTILTATRPGLYEVNADVKVASPSLLPSLLLARLECSDGSCRGDLWVDVLPQPDERVLGAALAAALSIGINLFGSLFPIAMLYLAYVYMARPRAQGSLEFVLARPITRLDLYLTRYVAGALVATVSTALVFATNYAANLALLGLALDARAELTLFAGVLASLLSFYGLCYALSAVTKGGRYLAASITAFLLFTVGYSVLSVFLAMAFEGFVGLSKIADYQYMLDYMSPLGAMRFANYYVLEYYDVHAAGEVASALSNVVSTPLVAASTALWIAVPPLLGWFAFRRANLSS
ncbi:MAG: ABC transporter permease subunit [Desulfurococcaceae archaeon]